MNAKLFKILIVFVFVLASCSKEDPYKTITASSIAFVHEDGTPIGPNECISPDTNYGILVNTIAQGQGGFRTTQVVFTLNGAPYILSFASDGKQICPIKLVDGTNEAKIVGTTLATSLHYNANTNYELVK